jgi:hypothetical protein
MAEMRPELIHVDLEEVDGVTRHSFPMLIRHLEQQMDPSLSDNVLFFYLTGSRLYGTATEESDWDYVCVTKRATREARKSLACLKNGDDSMIAAKPFMLTESNVYDMDATLEYYGMSTTDVPEGLRFDVSFFELKVWTRLAQEQSIIALEAQYIPSGFILYKDPAFPTYNIDPPVLKTTASLLAGLKFANARPRINNEKNVTKAKKLGALGIRYLQFAIQLLESYRDNQGSSAAITNWTSIKPVWQELFMQHHPSDYTEFELTFRPTFKALDTHLRQIMIYPTLYTIRETFSSKWNAFRPSIIKFGSIPHFKPLLTTDAYSSRALDLITSYFEDQALDTPAQDRTKMISQFHLFPSFSSTSGLASLGTTCHAPVYSNPALAEAHGTIIDCATGRILSGHRFSLLLDLVVLKPYLDSETTMPEGSYAELVALLEEEALEVRELYDSFRVALVHHNGDWNVSTIGGSIDASERIALRTTEGKGPPKTTVKEEFLKMFAIAHSLPPKSHNEALKKLDPARIYVFDLLTDCSRFVTANNPPRLVFQFAFPSTTDFEAQQSSISPARVFPEISKQLAAAHGWKERLNLLLDFVDLMNPFEQAGFEIRSTTTRRAAKLNARSYWSVRASVGHQNRVLAFNVAADNFEEESLLDVQIFGMQREFASTFPVWSAALSNRAAVEAKKIVNYLELNRTAYCTEPDRKSFATSIKDLPSPLKPILFDWYNYPFVSGFDILSSLELGILRLLKELISSEQTNIVDNTA